MSLFYFIMIEQIIKMMLFAMQYPDNSIWEFWSFEGEAKETITPKGWITFTSQI